MDEEVKIFVDNLIKLLTSTGFVRGYALILLTHEESGSGVVQSYGGEKILIHGAMKKLERVLINHIDDEEPDEDNSVPFVQTSNQA